MKKTLSSRLVAAALTAALAVTLAGCSEKKSTEPTASGTASVSDFNSASPSSAPTPSATASPVVGKEVAAGLWLPDGLALEAPTGPGVDEFGADRSEKAYEFVVALTYRANTWADEWGPKPLTTDEWKWLEPYFGGKMLSQWDEVAPKLAVGTDADTRNLVDYWFPVPARNADGSLAVEPVVSPWLDGFTVGPGYVTAWNDATFGKVTSVEFSMTFNFPKELDSRGRVIRYTPVTRKLSLAVTDNPDPVARESIPLVVTGGTWEGTTTGTDVTVAP